MNKITSIILMIFVASCSYNFPIKSDLNKLDLKDKIKTMKVRNYGLNYQNGEFELTTEYENTDYIFNNYGMIEEEIGYLSIKKIDTNLVLIPYRTIKSLYTNNLITKQTRDYDGNFHFESIYKYKQNNLKERIDSSSNGDRSVSRFTYSRHKDQLLITENIEELIRNTSQLRQIQCKYNATFELIEKKEFVNNIIYSTEKWNRNENGYEYDFDKYGEIIKTEKYNLKIGEITESYFREKILNSEKHTLLSNGNIITQFEKKFNTDYKENDIYTFDYEYDAKGNYVKMNKYLNGKKILIEIREIEYY